MSYTAHAETHNTTKILYPAYQCEGRAYYKVADNTLHLPLVKTLAVTAAITLQLVANTETFAIKQFEPVMPATTPQLQPCHAYYDFGKAQRLHIPFVDILAIPQLVSGTLQQLLDSELFVIDDSEVVQLGRLEPLMGAYFGVNLDWTNDSVAEMTQRLGVAPNVFVRFIPFPFSNQESEWLELAVEQIEAQSGSILLLTLEPHLGLVAVTNDLVERFAERLRGYNQRNIPVIVRFAHEMNGSWYAWGQRPTQYVRVFRMLAEAIQRLAPLSAMLWAPNYGGGYPFQGGRYEALPTASDFKLLDTNGNGQLDALDDPYAPYYPGDDVVDWVGMTLYHWGNKHPWGTNDIPESGKLSSQLRGDYNGQDGDYRVVPDFYGIYAEAKQKPMAIPETAALFVPALSTSAAEERLIKQLWWRQVLSPEVRQLFPRIKMINWFEWRKAESELNGKVVDWRVSHDAELAQAFVEDLRQAWVGFFGEP